MKNYTHYLRGIFFFLYTLTSFHSLAIDQTSAPSSADRLTQEQQLVMNQNRARILSLIPNNIANLYTRETNRGAPIEQAIATHEVAFLNQIFERDTQGIYLQPQHQYHIFLSIRAFVPEILQGTYDEFLRQHGFNLAQLMDRFARGEFPENLEYFRTIFQIYDMRTSFTNSLTESRTLLSELEQLQTISSFDEEGIISQAAESIISQAHGIFSFQISFLEEHWQLMPQHSFSQIYEIFQQNQIHLTQLTEALRSTQETIQLFMIHQERRTLQQQVRESGIATAAPSLSNPLQDDEDLSLAALIFHAISWQ